MRKWLTITTIGLVLAAGCGKKSDTLDDQMKTPEPPPQQEVAPEPEPEPMIDSAAIREEQLQQDAELALKPIYFEFDSYVLKEESRNILAGVGDFMNKYAEVKITIEGHCDDRGSAEYNMALGQKRADVALRYLDTYGISSSRISTVSWGEERPAEAGQNEEAWAKNRRDEITYSK